MKRKDAYMKIHNEVKQELEKIKKDTKQRKQLKKNMKKKLKKRSYVCKGKQETYTVSNIRNVPQTV